MLNDPCELADTINPIQDLYLNLIHYLDSNGVDIQPHVSPIDLYINSAHPYWANYTLDTIKAMFSRNYHWEINSNGRKAVVTGEDVFDLNDINTQLIHLLHDYNREWTKQTNLLVQGYASHGSPTIMNRVINNADILDQFVLLNTSIYKYDTYNSRIFSRLTYLSDNTLPSWMTEPLSINSDRYQFLMHPYQWSVLRRP
jgi:hypothetical protein